MEPIASGRRSFRRRAVQVEVSIQLKPPHSIARSGIGGVLTLVGRTKNMSENGMALVVSANNIDRYLKHAESALEIKLKLPAALVELHATPVYYKRYSSGGVVNYLIGARFVNVGKQQHHVLVQFLRSIPPATQTD
jgi:hypothetical protein